MSLAREVTDALQAWRSALGSSYVCADADARARVETATFRTEPRAIGVLRPANRQEVQECLRIANRFGVPVYPISRGRNWGLGSSVPVVDGCAVMDLSRLDRIVGFSEEYGYLTVEPGVTFTQAWHFLQERRSGLMLNATGGPPDSSLIGNALERGHGSGLNRDRNRHMCALEVVLPDGEVFRTGVSRVPHAHAALLHRTCAGPHLDGIFSQFNVGVVTEATFWLTPLPSDITDFVFTVGRGERVLAAIDALRGLCLDERFECVLHNLHRLTFDLRSGMSNWTKLGRKLSAGADAETFIVGGGTLYCQSAAEGWALRRRMLRTLRGKVDSLLYLSPFRRRVFNAVRRVLRFFGALPHVEVTAPRGSPRQVRVAAMYAAKREGPRPREVQDVDLDRDRCGVLWYCPILPFSGRHLLELMAIVEDACRPYGLEPQLSLQPMGTRSLEGFVALVFDRDDPDADVRALECYDLIADRLFESGYPPYRLPIHRMDLTARGAPSYAAFLHRMKLALDPNDILAPGRYDGRIDSVAEKPTRGDTALSMADLGDA